ncbi:sensor histidine kinase [Brevundimonas sp. PAMC22021]|uniref:sensor histidine kinase n=1 Tax=Brevundimonas sp. PAMC22021 TaxID=2861285 RepID=UPI0021080FFA|nr:histidine kinase dimerization/phosphoacceptor domain -containing protein [Brevundimonas sp. PAMC22021]
MNAEAIRSRPVLGYGLAIGAWLAAFVLRVALADWFPPGFPYLTFFPAVVVAAYFAGLWPSILTAVLSGLSAWWFWIGAPGFDWSPATAVALVFFAFVVAVDIFFIVGMTSARGKLEAEAARSAALAQSRDLLYREVQHRVSNNIQVVSSLLRLEAGMAKDGDARRILTEAASRTALIAKVQRGLSDAEGRATPFEAVARDLCADALAAAAREDVALLLDGGQLTLTAEEATPVMLILLECVNNALEHGLADREGRIEVVFAETEGQRRLTVRDDGRGLPSGFDAGRPSSLGLRIVHGLAGQLGGRFEMEHVDPGVRCALAYPIPRDIAG